MFCYSFGVAYGHFGLEKLKTAAKRASNLWFLLVNSMTLLVPEAFQSSFAIVAPR